MNKYNDLLRTALFTVKTQEWLGILPHFKRRHKCNRWLSHIEISMRDNLHYYN